jgi:hypothetical protein
MPQHRYTETVLFEQFSRRMDKGPRGRKASHLHISEKKIHEGIFMFVKQSTIGARERQKHKEKKVLRSFVDVHFSSAFFLTTKT